MRRVQTQVSPEIQALLRLTALVARDGKLALAMVSAGHDERRAAISLSMTCASVRQRIVRLVERVEGEFKGFRVSRLAVTPRIVSYDDVDSLGGNGNG